MKRLIALSNISTLNVSSKYNGIKANLKDNEMLLHVDFSNIKQQSEIQSVYFGNTGFSIFTACCYVKENEELKKHNITIVTEASDHSRMATHSLILKVIDEVKSQYPRFNDFEKFSIHLRSDGCTFQFRFRFVFHFTVFFPEFYQVVRYYNECHHGKGPMDGVGGCVKNMVFRGVFSEKVVIHTPEDFSRYADGNIKGVSVLFMATSEKTEEPDFIRETTYAESICTLKVHVVKTKAVHYYLQFFKIDVDDNPFYTHWYRRPGDFTDPCGHTDLPVHYVFNETCKSCFQGKTGSSWICSPLCSQWYHDECSDNYLCTLAFYL